MGFFSLFALFLLFLAVAVGLFIAVTEGCLPATSFKKERNGEEGERVVYILFLVVNKSYTSCSGRQSVPLFNNHTHRTCVDHLVLTLALHQIGMVPSSSETPESLEWRGTDLPPPASSMGYAVASFIACLSQPSVLHLDGIFSTTITLHCCDQCPRPSSSLGLPPSCTSRALSAAP